ncbi:MAG: MBL fold metallo-hydrolase [Oscillospiraceae bacterium]|nr:MBL fold metallo-hydrolase [Oscillospiraceae bacterium]
MRGRNRVRRGNFGIVILLVAAVVSFAALSTMQDRGQDFGLPEVRLPSIAGLIGQMTGSGADQPVFLPIPDAQETAPGQGIEVHFLDVGQGESVLIVAPEKNVLIDGGDNGRGPEVLGYLRGQGVERVDILIATHPHADHIGGLIEVVRELEIGEVILPELPDQLVPTTRTYTNFLMALLERELSITPARPGQMFALGDGATLTILGPIRGYSEVNDFSVVSRLEYGQVSFLFTGDIEVAAESDLAHAGGIRSSVLSVAHHGSRTSTTQSFLNAVAPNIAVISAGMDNRYGHPHRSTIERLEEMDVRILRTDLNGTIVLVTDGEALGIQTAN